jgi:hypothetical protein
MSLVAQIYESAANAGLLKDAFGIRRTVRHRNGIRSDLPRPMNPFSTA